MQTQARRPSLALVLPMLAVAALACQPEEPVYDDELGLQAVSIEPGSFAGAFVQKHSITTLADIPALEDPTAGGESYLLVERTWDAATETYSQVSQLCGGRLYETAGTVSTITPERWRLVPPSDHEVVTVDHELGTFSVLDHVELWSIDLPNPCETEMPKDVGEAQAAPHADRIYDADDDGHPGMTMEMSGFAVGEVYFIQRKRLDVEGLIIAEDKAAGLVPSFKYEQVTVGASSEVLNRQLPRSPSPNPKDAWFEEARIGDTADCDDVMQAVDDELVSRLNPFL